jgi:hypothetical protein
MEGNRERNVEMITLRLHLIPTPSRVYITNDLIFQYFAEYPQPSSSLSVSGLQTLHT